MISYIFEDVYECTQCKAGSPKKCRLAVSVDTTWSEGERPTTCPYERNEDIEGVPAKPKWVKIR